MDEVINYVFQHWQVIGVFGLLVALYLIGIKQERERQRQIYLIQRNEEVSRISDGVANGILAVFTNEEFLQALKDGAYVKIDINVDGSQNIVIAGNQNQILRG
ncbi:hypothetical protein [Campylobacter mucosalis]|uniref:Uncharacterized protein n=1 Tax=Campylobacter mucosalis CCUG 21559 TaxID=1032067 RepID=A0A6G5QFU0_9BACT|nr:hypothetical protein [Campylobacter mucosalis]QCD44437.1 hypothetical protein CMUC_0638 [Campylobacter mucosalis CCUG 21559]